jgi:2-polyprenyl-3-methyl-5-hydroxy-6-metoxy-1,4-benzoquinol methylase
MRFDIPFHPQGFEFGQNWRRFLQLIDDERISLAEGSLCDMLELTSLEGRRFLDVGSGSGLFSLAARRLGAHVRSFDCDPQAVGCARHLKALYFDSDPGWAIELGSILDGDFLQTLGQFDVVYAWGVLHHTGNMWAALANAADLVAPGGSLFVALYNNQGGASRRWSAVKRLYARSHHPMRWTLIIAVGLYFEALGAIVRVLHGQSPLPFKEWREKKKRDRGMSVWYDLVDWVGGYPFEVARLEDVFHFCRSRGFRLRQLKTCGGGHGCNEFVFERPLPTA